jgi:hypothetical protein
MLQVWLSKSLQEGKQRNATSHIAVISVDPDFFYFYFIFFLFLIDININIIVQTSSESSVNIYNRNSSLINRMLNHQFLGERIVEIVLTGSILLRY